MISNQNFFSYSRLNTLHKISLELFINSILFFKGLLCDLLWSDPDKDTMGWGENDRGVSFTFGAEVVAKFLHKHDFDLICRAHQVSKHKYFTDYIQKWSFIYFKLAFYKYNY